MVGPECEVAGGYLCETRLQRGFSNSSPAILNPAYVGVQVVG